MEPTRSSPVSSIVAIVPARLFIGPTRGLIIPCIKAAVPHSQVLLKDTICVSNSRASDSWLLLRLRLTIEMRGAGSEAG